MRKWLTKMGERLGKYQGNHEFAEAGLIRRAYGTSIYEVYATLAFNSTISRVRHYCEGWTHR